MQFIRHSFRLWFGLGNGRMVRDDDSTRRTKVTQVSFKLITFDDLCVRLHRFFSFFFVLRRFFFFSSHPFSLRICCKSSKEGERENVLHEISMQSRTAPHKERQSDAVMLMLSAPAHSVDEDETDTHTHKHT